MERHLKERLVGAVVIVIIGVVFIPVLLNGPGESDRPVERDLTLPSGDGVRTVTLPVGGSDGEPAPMPAPAAGEPVAPRPDAGAVQRPLDSGPTASKSASSTQARPEPAPVKPAPKPSPEPSPGAGQWAVQVGSFSRLDNARRLAEQLKSGGFDAYLSRVVTDAGTMHRVRVGPVADRDAAEALLKKLTRAGQKGRVVGTGD